MDSGETRTRPVDNELKTLCEIVVAGKDNNIAILSKSSLDELSKSLVNRNTQNILDWCQSASEADDMLQNDRYDGGCDGNNSYSFAFEEKRENAIITLSLEEVRAIAEGKTTEVRYNIL